MIQQKEITHIDSVFTCQNADIESVLNRIVNFKERATELDYAIYIIGIYKVVFAVDLQNDQKKEILSQLVSNLTISDQNIGAILFEQVPNAFLFQMLIFLHNFGVNIEPLLRNVDLNLYENGLSQLQVLGDFTDQKFIENLLFFYKKLGKDRYQKALHDIAMAAAKANNVCGCVNLIKNIKDGNNKTEVLISLVNLNLKLGETNKTFEIVEKSEEKTPLLSDISRFLLRNGHYEEVLNLLKSHDDPCIKFEILLRIIHYHIDRGEFKIIDVLLDQAIEQIRRIEDYFTKAICSSKLVEVEMRWGRDQEMNLHISDVLCSIDNQLDFKSGCLVFNDLFTRLVIDEKYELADVLLTKRWSGTICAGQIEFDVNHTTDVNHTILLIIKLINELASEDSVENKMEIERLHACTLTSLMFLRDTSGEDYLLHEIALSYSKHGYYSEALEILGNIEDKDYKNHLASAIPIYAAGKGDFEKALELVDKIDTHRIKVETQLTIATVLQKNGFHSEALEFIRNWTLYKLRQAQY
jgi:tetratricopeptide (TPR) repeat protein